MIDKRSKAASNAALRTLIMKGTLSAFSGIWETRDFPHLAQLFLYSFCLLYNCVIILSTLCLEMLII